ncbi:gluconeogenesis factor YvcK family protein [Bhargavaea cecembensis]|uniref:gluconeogenesis factor YvcK family protein n=1 Tax=Bhargavaea cecembensis TaxID=394098 RepID=UPI00058C27F1|nr:YvcK family protein [Bhargavaea cecembensis]
MPKKQGGKRIVAIGGGTGLSTILRGLKKYDADLTAIVTVADDGGSSGRIRKDYLIPPPGDVRNVMAALSDVEPLVEMMFQYRFGKEEPLNGHSLGNLMLAAMTNITGDFARAVAEMSRILNIKGRVLPAANQVITLGAELDDGSIINGESKIPAYGRRIRRVFLIPEDAEPLEETVRAIQNADQIIIAPGSLYTSILPNLLVPGIRDAVLRAKAEKVYICNIMTQPGETYAFTAEDHVQALYDHLGTPFLDGILVHDGRHLSGIIEEYEKQQSVPVIANPIALQTVVKHVMIDDIATIVDNHVRHDAGKVAERLLAYPGSQDRPGSIPV